MLREILNTQIYDRLSETPLTHAGGLSDFCQVPVLLKREDTQPIFSFKVRGAYHKMKQLPAAQLARGVVAASAGNHAQGVAWASRNLNTSATIVMPKFTPRIRVDAVRARDARVILHGEVFDDAYAYARTLAREKRQVFIPPFDDLDIIAGNGTIAAEILRQCDAKMIFCAVGGGGLVSGVASYVKALRPQVRVVGVEAEESASMTAAVRAGRRVCLPKVGIFADSVAVKQAGRTTWDISRHLVDEWMAVTNDEICAAIKDIYIDTRVVVEPAGALAAAAIKKYARSQPARLAAQVGSGAVVGLVCGANMNFDRLRFIAERAEIGERRESLLAVTIPERPGSFSIFCSLLGNVNVTEFNYRLSASGDGDDAHIFVGLEVGEGEARAETIRNLRAHGLATVDLTDDEVSKSHIRHMVGGRAQVANECLYRFEFPERPGALRRFLQALSEGKHNWNISLFHYRNHGSDVGRVLCGIQVPPRERKLFAQSLQRLGYPYFQEKENAAYRLFLS